MMSLSTKTVLNLLSFWPPFLVSGIRILDYDKQSLHWVRTKLTTRFWNSNYFGTHYGGSMFSMCDPFYVFLLFHHLGKDYIVWDKTAEIDFVKATKKPVSAYFEITENQISEIKQAADSEYKVEPIFTTNIITADGEVVAKVLKQLYVRKKQKINTK